MFQEIIKSKKKKWETMPEDIVLARGMASSATVIR